MGTRGLIGFVIDGQVKATYNHFDSYPDGVGVDVLAFARHANEHIDTVGKAVRKLRAVDATEKPTAAQRASLERRGASPANVSTGSDWYAWLRDTQGDLQKVLDLGYFSDDAAFAQDSLFCEWGYLVNLDEQTLEAYRGFQRSPLHVAGRFREQHSNGEGYAPITLAKTYPLSSLPSDADFVAELEAFAEADR